MTWVLLTPELVDTIHDEVLNPGELAGWAGDKSLDAALARVENRVAYGMVGDIFDLAATYATVIARGHCFNDGNKRTAFRAMHMILRLNGDATVLGVSEVGPLIVALAQGAVDEGEIGAFLRGKAG